MYVIYIYIYVFNLYIVHIVHLLWSNLCWGIIGRSVTKDSQVLEKTFSKNSL